MTNKMGSTLISQQSAYWAVHGGLQRAAGWQTAACACHASSRAQRSLQFRSRGSLPAVRLHNLNRTRTVYPFHRLLGQLKYTILGGFGNPVKLKVWFLVPRSEEHTSELQSRENLV